VRDCVERRSRSNGGWMEATGCAIEGAICTCAPAQNRCGSPQVLAAYGLQDSRNKHRNPKTKSNPNTMCLPNTLGEDHGSGHFYLAKTRTFLLCVDTAHHALRPEPTASSGQCIAQCTTAFSALFPHKFNLEVALAETSEIHFTANLDRAFVTQELPCRPARFCCDLPLR